MLIDLHTHTTASDGALTAGQLTLEAARAGIELLSITDHDSVAAYADVTVPPALTLVTGIELSALWAGRGIHVVGLDVDASALAEPVRRQTAARERRAERIVTRLAKRGIKLDLDRIRERADGAAIGRPHIAAEMLASGAVGDLRTAFRKYLGPGKAGDVKNEWPDLDVVIDWIRAADGSAVLAHPLRYRLTRSKLELLAADFRSAGGAAVELISGPATAPEISAIADLAERHNFTVSLGSDFHAPVPWRRLGVDSTRIGRLIPVWDRW